MEMMMMMMMVMMMMMIHVHAARRPQQYIHLGGNPQRPDRKPQVPQDVGKHYLHQTTTSPMQKVVGSEN